MSQFGCTPVRMVLNRRLLLSSISIHNDACSLFLRFPSGGCTPVVLFFHPVQSECRRPCITGVASVVATSTNVASCAAVVSRGQDLRSPVASGTQAARMTLTLSRPSQVLAAVNRFAFMHASTSILGADALLTSALCVVLQALWSSRTTSP